MRAVDGSELTVLDQRSHALFAHFLAQSLPIVAFVGGEAGNLARVAAGELPTDLGCRDVSRSHSERRAQLVFLYRRARSFSAFERGSSSGDSSAC